ncbi:MAG: type II toxin-antitoxin system death-on-curing family toxin [Candidatus Latescibacteria bacterium]|nr:type II toxin-antitoxin system death-on-curing family toxin [Candidatus Latescibacterota bacterium]
MRFLRLNEIFYLHRRIIEETGGATGLRDAGALDSALAQPRMTFGGADLYPGLAHKAAALCFSLVQNHPFVDGNKRVGHAAMVAFLELNGHRFEAGIDEQEHMILGVAASAIGREEFVLWVSAHIVEKK